MEGKKFIAWNIPSERVVIHRACREELLQVIGRPPGTNKEAFMEGNSAESFLHEQEAIWVTQTVGVCLRPWAAFRPLHMCRLCMFGRRDFGRASTLPGWEAWFPEIFCLREYSG